MRNYLLALRTMNSRLQKTRRTKRRLIKPEYLRDSCETYSARKAFLLSPALTRLANQYSATARCIGCRSNRRSCAWQRSRLPQDHEINDTVIHRKADFGQPFNYQPQSFSVEAFPPMMLRSSDSAFGAVMYSLLSFVTSGSVPFPVTRFDWYELTMTE